jgi:hypothetical protein
MFTALLGAFGGQLGDAALGLDGLDARCAQFSRFLHHPVHLVAAAHGLCQFDNQRLLDLGR